MNKTAKEISQMIEYLGEITETFAEKLCFIEKVNMFRGDNAAGKQFGIEKLVANFNFLKASLVANKIPFVEVAPVTWQSQLKLILPKAERKEETQTMRKGRYKERAQDIFKALTVTLWNSDALLIMYFGFMKLQHDRDWIQEKMPQEEWENLFQHG